MAWANRMPAAANYLRRPDDSRFRAFKLDVLRIEGGLIAEITTFGPELFAAFGLATPADRAGGRQGLGHPSHSFWVGGRPWRAYQRRMAVTTSSRSSGMGMKGIRGQDGPPPAIQVYMFRCPARGTVRGHKDT